MIAVVINPVAGGARPDAARKRANLAASVLTASGEAWEVFVTERKGHAKELASIAADAGARLVFAWGGDGTVNEVASALIGRTSALGIVPAGSGNGLARELGVSLQPERAIREATAAVIRSIDAGELGGRCFVSVAGVGFDAHIAACFDNLAEGRRGFSGYIRTTARELIRFRPKAYRLAGSELRRAFLITLANSGQWGNGARIAPGARVDDGLLDLVVFEERSRIATICGLPRVFAGTIARQRGISIRQVREVTIESEEPMLFHVDGEVVAGGRRLDGKVHPGALRVAVRSASLG